jgi:cyclopropane-fatty-acyl-phospholipid synthase
MKVADRVAPLLRNAFGRELPVTIRCWDGSTVGPPSAPLLLDIKSRRALRRVLWAPNQLGLARAYVSGDIDLDGDLLTGLDQLDHVARRTPDAAVTVDRATKRAIVKTALSLGAVGLPPKPPAEEARLVGRRHSRTRDASAVTHHYDVGNDFYRIVLGPSMTYSCAYFEKDQAAGFGLDQAQLAKCDLVARKLGLKRGMRVLDVGCGWGTFAIHAARTYGARVVGVTLSTEQAKYARRRVLQEGLTGQVEIRVQDYRDVADGPYEAISSIGMAEHVGANMLPIYAGDLFGLLRPHGRLLNHAISRRPGPRVASPATSFIERYVFPDGELEPMSVMVGALETAGFEVRDVESLREHYALTLRAWVANLERGWDRAIQLSGPARARIWRLYMAGSALAFENNRIGVNQILAVKPDRHGFSAMPRTRLDFLGRPQQKPAADVRLAEVTG